MEEEIRRKFETFLKRKMTDEEYQNYEYECVKKSVLNIIESNDFEKVLNEMKRNSNGNVKKLINDAYRLVLNRDGDSAGVNAYYESLIRKEFTFKDLIRFLIESKEHREQYIMFRESTVFQEDIRYRDLNFDFGTNIIIYVYNFNPLGGGCTVLHYLCHLLNSLSDRTICYLCPVIQMPNIGVWFEGITSKGFREKDINRPLNEITQEHLNDLRVNHMWRTPIISKEMLLKRNNMVIYSDEICGNPIEQKYVCRWILYLLLGDAEDRYNDEDLLMYYSEPFRWTKKFFQEINNNIPKKDRVFKETNLTIFANVKMLLSFFINRNEKRTETCYQFRKASKNHPVKMRYEYTGEDSEEGCKVIHPKGSIKMDNYVISKKEMLDMFNKCYRFYCYDAHSLTAVLAALCGCVAIVPKIDGLAREDLYKDCPWMTYGIAYGDDEDEIKKAESTLHLVKRNLEKSITKNQENIIKFIKDIKEKFEL